MGGPEWRRSFAVAALALMAVLTVLGALFVHAAYLLATLVLLIFLDEASSR
jgi:hypothetical protein